jgi:uncharacterized protein
VPASLKSLEQVPASVSEEPVLKLAVRAGVSVSARLLSPPGARACYVLAHGAGAGMDHPSMRTTAQGLAELGIATLRFQFPYMENRSRRPDPAPLCHATVRAAVAEARRLLPALPLFAGGRSFGGRMSSQAQALEPLAGVRGLVFLGFPLHPAAKPAVERAEHLTRVHIPMLFVQGTRDALAEHSLMQTVIAQLGARASADWVKDADHSFHVPARGGRTDAEVRTQLLAAAARWMEAVA